jgi:hypothetical protein
MILSGGGGGDGRCLETRVAVFKGFGRLGQWWRKTSINNSVGEGQTRLGMKNISKLSCWFIILPYHQKHYVINTIG